MQAAMDAFSQQSQHASVPNAGLLPELNGWLAAAERFNRDVGVAPCDANIDDLCRRFEGAAIDLEAV
jgi:hypothetical protein